MKLTPQALNSNLVEFNSGIAVLFSYKTAVAAFVPGVGYLRTELKYSASTTKHINSWLGSADADVVSQDTIDNLIGGL